jgi:hypothetical protein
MILARYFIGYIGLAVGGVAMKTSILKVLLVAASLGCVQIASAADVKCSFVGHISFVYDYNNALADTGITDSSTFVGYLSYDSSAASIEVTTNYTAYPGVLFEITIDGTYTTRSMNPVIQVGNDVWDGGHNVDFLNVWEREIAEIESDLPGTIDDFYLILRDNSHSAFSDRNSPVTLDSANFDERRFYIEEDTFPLGYKIEGVIDSLKPFGDSDNDGVADEWDHCPNTPEGSAVYANGCPATMGDYNNDGDVDGTDLADFAVGFGL